MPTEEAEVSLKGSTTGPRASHVNSGTSISREELPWPEVRGRVLRMPAVQAEVDARSDVTPYGGLVLFNDVVRRFRIAKLIDEHVGVFKVHAPYHESDHVLTQAMSLFVGGSCLEDIAQLQHSEAVRRLVGAPRLPDPTTAGDFLRRFREGNPFGLPGLRRANDEAQSKVWRALATKKSRRKRKRDLAVVDLDAHVKPLYGVQKQGADFYKGTWCYQPLVATLAGSGECLAIRNQPGAVRASDGAPEILDAILPRMNEHFRDTLVRGDSDFDRKDIRDCCERAGAYFAFVGREFKNRPGIAESIPESQWRPFRTRAHRERLEARKRPGYRRRRKKRNQRRTRARKRKYNEKRLVKQWTAEVPWTPPGSSQSYRLVIRRQLIENYQGQQFLFEEYRYRYIVTNLPASVSTQRVVDLTYERCDQENLIEQLGNGLAAWRMPVAEFDGNSAWLEIARLAWNIGKWIAQLVLAAEVVRWEWKRFRLAWVYLAAHVTRVSRQIRVRLSGSHRFARELLRAHLALQT